MKKELLKSILNQDYGKAILVLKWHNDQQFFKFEIEKEDEKNYYQVYDEFLVLSNDFNKTYIEYESISHIELLKKEKKDSDNDTLSDEIVSQKRMWRECR